MKKSAYQAWDVREDQFRSLKTPHEQLLFFVHCGSLAPSSHNSQPWEFSVTAGKSGGTINIYPSKKRMLPESDTNMRQLYISLGCAIENIVVAGEYFGYRGEVNCAGNDNTAYASIALTRADTPKDSSAVTFAALHERRTNRTAYEAKNIPPFELPERLRDIQGLRAHYVSDQKLMHPIADATLDAIDAAMLEGGFRKELSRYVIHNLSSSGVGMPGFTIGIPTPLSFIIPFMIRNFPPPKSQREQNERLLKTETSTYLIITTEGDAPKDWMTAGQLYEHIALRGSMEDVFAHPMAAAIQIGDHYKKIQVTLNTSARPQFFARIGKTGIRADHSPRLSLNHIFLP